MKKKYLHNISLLVLFALFLWQTISATLKYVERNTITSTSIIDEGSIMFPSITVCKKYLNGPNEEYMKDLSKNIDEKIEKLHTLSWRRNEVFYFLSHSNMFNISFPCTTTEGSGTSQGKPCSFPFLDWEGKQVKSCGEWQGGCITRYIMDNKRLIKSNIFVKCCYRTFDNYSSLYFGVDSNYQYWGNCKAECKGEMPVPESEFNLAKDTELFNSAWSHGLYDLMKWGAGSCFTYDPPQKSGSGVSNGLYFLLGHEKLFMHYRNSSINTEKDSSFYTYSFDVYLHEKVKCVVTNN